MRLAMGIPLKAEEAYRIGLAQWLVPHAELMPKTVQVARHIASMPPLAARLVKESLLRGMGIPNLSDASLVDLYRFMALELTEDKTKDIRPGGEAPGSVSWPLSTAFGTPIDCTRIFNHPRAPARPRMPSRAWVDRSRRVRFA